MKRILIVTDFSEITNKLIEQATLVAEESSEISVLHVIVGDPEFGGYLPGPKIIRDQAKLAATFPSEHQNLDRCAKELRRLGFAAKTVLLKGPTVEAILEEAEKEQADLIVLGSHGYSAVYTLLLGSVSAGVLKRASCPLLVVPSRIAE